MIFGALAGATMVVIANVVLRPIARRVDRVPDAGDEVERPHRFSATCAAAQEAHVRTLVVNALAGPDFGLRSLRSDDLPGGTQVEIRAELVLTGQGGSQRLEEAVSRLSLEPAVTSVSWELVPDGD
jgi:putative Mg2+ transporter-C (MgtC) family protein